MKQIMKLTALILALCVLAGCSAAPAPAPEQPQETILITVEPTPAAETETEPTEEPTAAAETEAGETEAEAVQGEPDGWEEEWPEEYPVTEYRLLDGAFTQSGELNCYRYSQLPEAETYMDLLADAACQTLGCERDELNMSQDSAHDGYANWSMEAPNGWAWASGSSITGRFTYGIDPGFDRVLTAMELPLDDTEKMEQAAAEFAARFAGITGELTLVGSTQTSCYYHDERSQEWKDIVVPALRCIFTSSASSVQLPLNDQENVPVTCGDSEIEDLTVHSFAVTVWADGTVVGADNYITRAQIVPDGTIRMIDESDVPRVLEYLSSMTENDTVVIERVRAAEYSVYFGHAEIEPTVTVDYYFESDPENHQSTLFVLPGVLD